MTEPLRAFRQRPLLERIRAWLEQHQDAAQSALRRLLGASVASQLTIAVIGIALVLPATLQVFIENTRQAARGFDAALDVSVYLKAHLPEIQGRALATRIGQRPDVQLARYVSPDEGLTEFRRWSGLGSAVEAVGRNPLPGAIIVRPRSASTDPVAIDRLVQNLGTLPEADQVQFDGAWVRRYTSLVDAIARVAEILGGLFAVSVLLIVGNTVRLDVDARRHEIEIMKLLGATDGFVRRPVLYAGLWYGLLGGIAGCALLELLVLLVRGPVSRVASAYGSTFAVTLPSGGLILLLIGGGAGLGWLGAWLAASRHLRAIAPGQDD